jgi:hypothetical protein
MKTREHNVSETGSVSVLRWGGPLERANLSHWTTVAMWLLYVQCLYSQESYECLHARYCGEENAFRTQVVISREAINCKQKQVQRDQSVNGIARPSLEKQRDGN